jgi:threonine aldolase
VTAIGDPAVMQRGFASDNWAGVHPEVLAALGAVNDGHVPAYGADRHTERATARLRGLFGDDAEVFLVFNGTGANVLGLQALVRSWEAVICAETAHVNADECGAPERHAGCKLLPILTPDGKLRPDDVAARVRGVGDEHHVQPRVVSISQSTEYGTVYRPDEVRALADVCRAHDLRLHVDGARILNAAAALGLPPRAFTRDAGVDVVSFGATKAGALGAEAVVVLDPSLAGTLRFLRKQSMQLASKMRYLAAQVEALLEGDVGLRGARHANSMAARLAEGARELPGVAVTQPVEANVVFARVPAAALEALQAVAPFYVWDERTTEVRWMTSWDTTEEDVDGFVEGARRVLT